MSGLAELVNAPDRNKRRFGLKTPTAIKSDSKSGALLASWFKSKVPHQ